MLKKFFFKRGIFCALAFFAISNIANAQITYNGKILNIGGATENGKFNFLVDKFSGLYWTFNGGNKFFQCDVTPASPRLAGTSNQVVFYNSFTSTYNSIQVANVYNYSDERAKTNIHTLNSGLNTVLNLRPVSYNWKTPETSVESLALANESDATQPFGPNDGKIQYGFLAQEVEEVLPDAVATDEEGNKLINYTAIIPHLVQSIQELQGLVAEQAATIERLNSQIGATQLQATSGKIMSCTPNPASNEVTFDYAIPNDADVANIVICSLTGNVEKTIACSSNASSVTENISNLKDGIYVATLVIDGVNTDAKRVIVSK